MDRIMASLPFARSWIISTVSDFEGIKKMAYQTSIESRLDPDKLRIAQYETYTWANALFRSVPSLATNDGAGSFARNRRSPQTTTRAQPPCACAEAHSERDAAAQERLRERGHAARTHVALELCSAGCVSWCVYCRHRLRRYQRRGGTAVGAPETRRRSRRLPNGPTCVRDSCGLWFLVCVRSLRIFALVCGCSDDGITCFATRASTL